MSSKRRAARKHSTVAQAAALVKSAGRLRAEIETLENSLFNLDARDPYLRCENLKTYRFEIMRTFVVSLHLAIEDLLHAILFDFLARQNRRLTKKETIKIVDGLRSAELIHWCGRLNLVTPSQYSDLIELNRIRNACAHQWILGLSRTKRVGPKWRKKRIRVPIVVYGTKNLFTSKTFTDEFCPVYSGLYLKLLTKVWRMQGRL